MMRMLNFAKRKFKELIRDPLSFIFEIIKVEGHSTNEYNNYVDKMAVQACQRIKENYEN